MGENYNHQKEYQNAIKCYKKILEIAWDQNLHAEELEAYDKIGIQYYYLGNLERSRYYNTRMMIGRLEADCSKIR